MQPTLNPTASSANDWVLIDKFHMRSHARIRRGDVVSFLAPDDPDRPMIKRLAAMPGEEVSIIQPGGGRFRGVMPPGHCWLIGDNADLSIDSKNKFGPVPIGLIQGRVVCVVWPPSRFGIKMERREPDPGHLVVHGSVIPSALRGGRGTAGGARGARR